MKHVLELQHAILRSRLPAPAKTILLALSVVADWDTGIIPDQHTPSLPTLAAMTSLAKSTVTEWLGPLESAGWLKRDRPDRSHHRTRYALLHGSHDLVALTRASRRHTSNSPAGEPGRPPELRPEQPDEASPLEEPPSNRPLRRAHAPQGRPQPATDALKQADQMTNCSADRIDGADSRQPPGVIHSGPPGGWVRQADPERQVPPSGPSAVRQADPGVPPGGPMTFLTSPTERSTTRDHPRARDAQGAARRRNDADVRGTRLPATFDVTAEMEEWARRNTPDVAQSATDAFRDYWRARPDPEGRKADWLAAWRGWMRREQATIERQPGYRGPARQTAPIAAIRIPVEAMCRDHRGHRAATCGLCRSERIEAR